MAADSGRQRTQDGLFAAVRGVGIRRDPDDRWVAGVCSGVAERLGVDPLLVRGIVLALVFLGGVGVLGYLVAWALIPAADGRILAQDGLHGHGGGVVLLAVIGIGIISGLAERWWLWLVLVPVGALVGWAVQAQRSGTSPEEMRAEASRFADRVVGSVSRRSPSAATTSGYASEPVPETGAGSDGSTGSAGTASSAAPAGSAGPAVPAAAALAAPAAAAAEPDVWRPPVASPLAPVPGDPHGMGPGRTGAVVTTPRPRHPVRPSRPRAGLLGLLLTAGLAAAGYGTGFLVATHLGLAGAPEMVALGGAVAGAGLGLVVIGLLGRRAGFTSFLVLLLALGAVAGTTGRSFPPGGFGERSWSAGSVPAGGYSLTAGDARLALAGATTGSTLKVHMGAGRLRISVPQGTTATVHAAIDAGQVVVTHADGSKDRQGDGVDTDQVQTVIVGTGATTVTVDATIVTGEIDVMEER